MSPKNLNILVNLPPTFFTVPQLKSRFQRLAKLGTVRKRSFITPDEIIKDLMWANAVVMWSWPVVTAEMLEKCPALGFMGQINTTQRTAKACIAKKVAISEARHCWSPAVAEMALTLMLAGLRKTSAYHVAMKAGTEKWVGDFPADIDPMERELTGAAVGIVGFGRIGQRLSELLKPFNVTLRVFDPYLPKPVAAHYGVKPAALSDVLRNSDVVVLCAANTEETNHLVGAKQVAMLRKNAVLVNVGRSSLIDMKALEARVRKGELTAMLDVFDKEPLEADSPLRSMNGVFCTPHRAGGLLSSVQRALDMLIGDLELNLKKNKRLYEVTEKMLPCFPE